jgi:hypothetical protein
MSTQPAEIPVLNELKEQQKKWLNIGPAVYTIFPKLFIGYASYLIKSQLQSQYVMLKFQ